MKLFPASIVSAFSPKTIGTKVVDLHKFYEVADAAVAAFDFNSGTTPGQGFISCHELVPYLSAGVGKRTGNEDDYIVRIHRGREDAYLRRSLAAPCEGAALVVYTVEAYLADPDVKNDAEECARVVAAGATHIIVAVLGFAGPKAPLTPYRLLHNMAGGNKDAEAWTKEDFVSKAKESLEYYNEWCVVAD